MHRSQIRQGPVCGTPAKGISLAGLKSLIDITPRVL
jgi:hypothetical protein